MDGQQPQSHDRPLTERERQVVRLAAFGLCNKIIARQLGLAEGTVRIHLHGAYRKLGIAKRTALAAIARGRLVWSLMSGIIMMLLDADLGAPAFELASCEPLSD